MIVLTIAGESSRFFKAGYKEVKYKLSLFNSKSILWHILSYIDRREKIILVTNKKFKDSIWLEDLLNNLAFLSYDIIEVDSTDGQLTSASLGLENSKFDKEKIKKEPLIIYNGDTIRHIPFNFNLKNIDGYIEVFKESGDHWSFVDKLGDVSKVKEKERISSYCSTGIYGFSSVDLFLKYSKRSKLIKKERYIAPLYNELIQDGLKVHSSLSERSCFTLCGTPEEYKETLNISLKE